MTYECTGSSIPNSVLVRAYCPGCGTPIRVTPAMSAPKMVAELASCERCRKPPPYKTGLTYHQAAKLRMMSG